jgi:cellulose synthase/poly-beta-1,6-N-acetylglucosamine synthase-like glycosyltransferase
LVQNTQPADLEVASEPKDYRLTIPAATRSLAHAVEQNTGSIVFRSGAGRDRGTYVRGFEVFYETDMSQYNTLEEVFAGCGASLLLRRKMLDEIGLLDGDFFMYYEDTDLSWRARLGGWKVMYAPRAVVPHVHCGTTKEWSPFFLFLTERNRLATVFKNGAAGQVSRVWGGYLLRVFRQGLETAGAWLACRPGWREQARQLRMHLRVMGSLLTWLPSLIVKRGRIQRNAQVKARSLEHWFVE